MVLLPLLYPALSIRCLSYSPSSIICHSPSVFVCVSLHSVALINHSCLATVIVTYDGTSADVRAVQDMKPGDEVRKENSCS